MQQSDLSREADAPREPVARPAAIRAFALPRRLAAKADPALTAHDERFFARLAASVDDSVADLSRRLAVLRAAHVGLGQDVLERDLEIHRLSGRLRAMRRYGLDLCLGRMVVADGGETVYLGRFGLTDGDGGKLLVDWRSAAAEPFFGATHADPMGLASRRRYRWTRGRITDYWDEAFTADGLRGNAALDDQSAFIASLGSSRSPRMRDVLATIQSDQDAVIRAGARGALVVDGGPGTGKTVVALHRAAYLLYADPRLSRHRGGVLFVGPHRAYLSYVADVLPSLGEEGVQICTLRDLVPEGASAAVEADPEVARLKASTAMVRAVEAAVRYYEEPPRAGVTVESDWADVWLGPEDWAEAFGAAEPGVAHNDAREPVWEQLLTILVDKHDDRVPEAPMRRSLGADAELRGAFARAWRVLDPAGVVADLYSVPAYLRLCAPWLTEAEVQALQRERPRDWTVCDLPLLDTARQLIGDPEAASRRRRRAIALAEQREQMQSVVDDLIRAEEHDDGEGLMTMLRGDDLRTALVDESALPSADPDLLAGPFAHVVVDEAQELSDAEWQMVLLRCPSRSVTVVGDRAQARRGFPESWEERLRRVGLGHVETATLSINYRTPQEVMAEAEPVIRAALPDANVPTSIRSGGLPVVHARTAERDRVLAGWSAANAEGTACVIGDPSFAATARIRSLTPETAKGLEFDLVVLVEPARFGPGIAGAVDRYVAMTRATQQLVVLTGDYSAAVAGA